jgi:hypothetical protein
MSNQGFLISGKDVEIKERIRSAFEAIGLLPKESEDLAFHMTDWLGDVREMEIFYSDIENRSADEIRAFVIRFLAHVPNHLNAAAKLSGIGKVQDVFQVGIFDDE